MLVETLDCMYLGDPSNGGQYTLSIKEYASQLKILPEISSLPASIQGKMSVMLLGKNGPLICLCEERLEY